MKIDWIEDIFAPLSKPDEDYFRLPSETNVTFIGSEEEIKLAEPLLEATCVGVDCEWRPSLVKFQNTKVALLQIGDKKNVFLFDMKKLNESSVLDELLTKVFLTIWIQMLLGWASRMIYQEWLLLHLI